MNAFRYQAIEASGMSVQGVVEAEDRKAALRALGQRGLFPSNLEMCAANGAIAAAPAVNRVPSATGRRRGIRRKDIMSFTRELSALVGAGIPIPQALDSLGEEEENAAFREVVLGIADSVQKGAALSASLEEHPKLFGKLYASMVRVGKRRANFPPSWRISRICWSTRMKFGARSRLRWRIRCSFFASASSQSQFC